MLRPLGCLRRCGGQRSGARGRLRAGVALYSLFPNSASKHKGTVLCVDRRVLSVLKLVRVRINAARYVTGTVLLTYIHYIQRTLWVEHIVHIDGASEPSARSAGCSEAEAY